MAKQSPGQKATVERVMHEFKHGQLKTAGGKGPKVRNPKQAIAIALHEAGASREETPAKNKKNLARTKAKEGRGAAARDAAQGGLGTSRSSGPTRQELYEAAKRKDVPGRSKMSKAELQRALAR